MKRFKKAAMIMCIIFTLALPITVSASEVTTEDLLARIETLEARVAALEGNGVVTTESSEAKAITDGIYVAGRDIEVGRITIKVTSGEIGYSVYDNTEDENCVDSGYAQAVDYEDSFNFSDTVTFGLEEGMKLSIFESSDEGVSSVEYTVSPFVNEE